MTPASTTRLPELLTKHEGPILERWVEEQLATIGPKRGLMSDAEMREQSREFLGLVRQAAQTGEADIEGAPWTAVRDFLGRISASRAVQGFSPARDRGVRVLAQAARVRAAQAGRAARPRDCSTKCGAPTS